MSNIKRRHITINVVGNAAVGKSTVMELISTALADKGYSVVVEHIDNAPKADTLDARVQVSAAATTVRIREVSSAPELRDAR